MKSRYQSKASSSGSLSSQPLGNAFDTFGAGLRFLRKRARLTQDELGRAVGYSREQIARLENGSRLPDLAVLAALFIPALGLQDEPLAVTHLLELAGAARRQMAPDEEPVQITVTHHVQQRLEVQETIIEPLPLATIAFPSASAVHQLPASPLPLIGREQVVAQACELLSKEARLLTLVGAPGVGKSRLAIEIGRQLAPNFAHGAVLVLLASVQSPTDLAPAVAAALGVPPAPSQSPEQAVAAYLASRHLLLLLDNCEHLLDAAPLFSDWLAAAPQVKLLCTSREALDLYGEYELSILPLALPDLAHLPALATLKQTAAVKLFVDRARAVDATFQLDDSNSLTVASLCVALDGLPLALELAAARIRTLPVQELLRQLVAAQQQHQSISALLFQSKRDIAARHRTLQEAIAWSYRLLSASAQTLFVQLGVFWGGCTWQAMQAVAGGEASDLASLIAANLVQCVDETGLSEAPAPAASRQAYELRYLLLETLRTFAIEQLLAQGRLTTLQRLHADYFADYAQTVFGGIRGVDQAQWLQRVRQDHENFRAALRFALQHELGEIAIAIAGGLWWFWNRQGLLSEGSTWLAAALRCPRESAEMTLLGQKRRATALNGAGSLATEQSRFAEAHAYHMEGLALRQAIGDLAGAADVMHNLGLLARCQGDYPQAIQWFSESMANYSKLNGDSVEQAIDYANLGITAYEMGDSQLARRALEEAHSRALHQDDQWVLAFVVCALAEFLHSNGELERAARLATEASQIYQLLGDTLFLPEPLLLLAKIALRRGDLPQAQALCQQALAIYRSLDDAHGLANAYQVQAWLALHEQATEEEEEPAKSRAADLAKQAYSLRASVARAISPREQTEFVKLEQAVAGRATLLHSQDR